MKTEEIVVKDLFNVDRKYTYSYIILEKKGKNKKAEPIKEHHVLFYTKSDSDDSLRYVEDAAKEISDLHRTPKEKTRFFEVQGKRREEIEMRWDSKQYRGTSWVPVDSFPWENV